MYASAPLAAFQGAGPLAGIDQASPHQQIELLLGGLLTRLARMRGAIRSRHRPARTDAANAALGILAYLRTILDPAADPRFVGSLRDLYRYCEARLLEASQADDESAVEEVILLITEIKSAWDAIAPHRAAVA
ncbi:flagellar protein FliS [Flagellatimonas centrodinii]|uniref:flagellar export chaperone FliS n=1 Tax=Flagellatimonas centrodinii TaxID=2806210 RepID=UPI001FEDA0DD|nr:flagellar export chaperone FliS [Flagellatimonas centrodinii]ULQ45623.1 flagellar protein FliS [Flagellatimonas centrodinii]